MEKIISKIITATPTSNDLIDYARLKYEFIQKDNGKFRIDIEGENTTISSADMTKEELLKKQEKILTTSNVLFIDLKTDIFI
jgi:hypothetical protein